MDALSNAPDFWIVMLGVMLAFLCVIFVGFYLLWNQGPVELQEEIDRLNDLVDKLASDNRELRRVLGKAQRNAEREIDSLLHLIRQ